MSVFVYLYFMHPQDIEMRQNSLERKENYGFGFLLSKVPPSHFPPQHPQKCAITHAIATLHMVLEGVHLDFYPSSSKSGVKSRSHARERG